MSQLLVAAAAALKNVGPPLYRVRLQQRAGLIAGNARGDGVSINEDVHHAFVLEQLRDRVGHGCATAQGEHRVAVHGRGEDLFDGFAFELAEVRLTKNLEDFGDFAVAFHDELVGVEELVAVETRQVRANVGLTGRHGANEHDGSGAFREVLVHFTHLLRVDASAGGLVFCECLCGDSKFCGDGELCGCHRFSRHCRFSRGCGQLGSIEGLLPRLVLFFCGGGNGCCGRSNLNLAEQRRGRTNRLGGFSRGHSYRMCRCRLEHGRLGRSRRRLGFSLLHGSRSALPRRFCRLSLLRRRRLGRGRLGSCRLGCFHLRGFLAGFLFSGAHALQGAEQLQAQVLIQAERRVGILRHRGGVQAHTLRARRSGGGQGAGARTHQVSGGGHARSRAHRRN